MELVVHQQWQKQEKWGSSSTSQTVSERRSACVTYCFMGKLPDLLRVKARSSLVYTQPWISAWNMSTSSQPISHRGGAVWAADTSRFPRTMRPIPHECPLCAARGVQKQTKTMALLHWGTLSPPLGHSWWNNPPTPGSVMKTRWSPSKRVAKQLLFCTSWIIILFFSCYIFT